MKKLLPIKICFILIVTMFSNIYANEFMENLEEVRKKNDNSEIKNHTQNKERKNIPYRKKCTYDIGKAKNNYAAKKIETTCLKAIGLK